VRTTLALWTVAFVAPLSFAGVTLTNSTALAVEGAMSPYLKGATAFMAGVLPPHPGTYFTNLYYHYDGDAGANVRNGVVELGVDMSLDLYALQGLFVTDAKILGGTYAFGALVDYAWADLSATIDGPLGPRAVAIDNSGIGDSFVWPFFLGWHADNFHFNVNMGVLLPTGEYEPGQLNLSKNVWALMPQVAVTYFDPESGLDISAAFTYVTMWRNDVTDYQSGDIVHLDWAIGLHLGAWEIGVAGNVVQQIEGDSGTGARLGSFKAQSWGLGPAINFNTKIGEMPLVLQARWQHDFDVKNTFEGDVVVASATLFF